MRFSEIFTFHFLRLIWITFYFFRFSCAHQHAQLTQQTASVHAVCAKARRGDKLFLWVIRAEGRETEKLLTSALESEFNRNCHRHVVNMSAFLSSVQSRAQSDVDENGNHLTFESFFSWLHNNDEIVLDGEVFPSFRSKLFDIYRRYISQSSSSFGIRVSCGKSLDRHQKALKTQVEV